MGYGQLKPDGYIPCIADFASQSTSAIMDAHGELGVWPS